MKFSNVLLFATAATAFPAVSVRQVGEVAKTDLIERQTSGVTAITTLSQALRDLSGSVSTSVNALNSTLNSIKNNVGASISVQVQALLKANFQAIATALQTSGSAVTAAWANLISNLSGNLQTLGTQDVAALLSAIQSTIGLLGQFTSLLASASANLSADVKTLIQSETQVIQSFVTGLIGPVVTFLASASGNIKVANNVPQFLTSILSVVTTLVQNLGVDPSDLNLGNLLGNLQLGPS